MEAKILKEAAANGVGMDGEDVKVDSDDIESCMKVLHAIRNGAGTKDGGSFFDRPEQRKLRKAVFAVSEFIEERKYGCGGNRLSDAARLQAKAGARGRESRKKKLDELYLSETKLRQGRRRKLEKLLEEQPHAAGLPLLAEGAVHEDDLPPDAERPPQRTLNFFQHCYVCKRHYDQLHFFYDAMCLPCAELNYTKRKQTANLRGKVAIVTGGRIKIGFETALKLLRAGAKVVETTRFPVDAARRYHRQPDFAAFSASLQIFGADFRDIGSLKRLLAFLLQRLDRLDILIHNACQTIRRPPAFYRHLIEAESQHMGLASGSTSTGDHELLGGYKEYLQYLHGAGDGDAIVSKDAMAPGIPPALLTQVPILEEDWRMENRSYFPENVVDVNGQQVDLRPRNSWTLRLGEVEAGEAAEVMAVNALVPFMISSALLPLMDRTDAPAKFIVNVSAMEGCFYRSGKTPDHPHTNMAKAALNMMTRTSAEDLATKNIFMNSVDTGWVNNERPANQAVRQHSMPLDDIDGAARILDPIFTGIASPTVRTTYGNFLKDYKVTEW